MKLNINGNTIDLDIEAFNKALEDKQESFDLTTDTIVVRSTDEHNAYIDNVKKEVGDHKVEIGRKEVLTGLGIEIEGLGIHKSLDKSMEALSVWSKGEVSKALEGIKIEPNKKVDELTKDLETVQAMLVSKDKNIVDLQGTFDGYKKTQTINEAIKSNMPANTILPANKMMGLVSGDIKLDINENGVVYGIGQDGQPIKDGNLNLVPVEGVMSSYFDKNPDYLKAVTGGAGGGDSTGKGGVLDFDAFVKQQGELGNNPSSIEFKNEADRLVKSGELVI